MKKTNFIFPIIVVILLVILLVGVIVDSKISVNRNLNIKETIAQPTSAFYYWRTWFSIEERESELLKKNKIGKLYVRFFDVDINKDHKFSDKCVPVATTTGLSEIHNVKNINIVPVVFITPEAIKEYASFTDNLAHRIYAMCASNNINIEEVQFDCDWTTSTHDAYFQFIKAVKRPLQNYFKKDVRLSSTIRLHQLSQIPPEVDYGVLMCYNTGDFKDYNTKNSILDIEDVKPYLKYLKSYKLPLALALPSYSWGVEFDKDKKFVCLEKSIWSINDTSNYRHLEDNYYELKKKNPETTIQYVRYEEISAATIMEAKKIIRKKSGKLPIVLFHLDAQQLSKYSDDEIKNFFK